MRKPFGWTLMFARAWENILDRTPPLAPSLLSPVAKMEAVFPLVPGPRPPFGPRSRRGTAGMTLVEIMVALGILALTTVGGISAFTFLNSHAANNRNQSSAKQLCQERIEQALTLPFNPPASLPTVTNSMGNTYSLLGTTANWSTGATALATGITTSTETVNVYVQQDGLSAVVPGTRTTTVTCAAPTTNNPLAQFTVQVTYTYRGRTHTSNMTVLRGAN